ncbi:MAG: rRNA cytosine-C5-methylase [Sneathiella sp.]|uniref:RsmB/NOP family class I SAM-dependent RNA methyltransferase n=1 Tax=Sneathiella sp. TaxID=1964365 RepID=UPI000C521B5C|nr:RsmB/NOP family class I SAM-dependent RNA methyltransferase [Sneathiella sp.]MAL80005.1 rRNA cytosine-C5-methylase [Sneathiella sp.]
MTPAARLAALAELLEEIAATDSPAEGIVAAYFRSRRFAGSKDRRWITERVFEALRRQGELAGAAAAVGLPTIGRVLALLYLLRIDRLDMADVTAGWFGGPHGLSVPDDDEALALSRAARLDDEAMGDVALSNFPDWLYQKITDQYGDGAAAVMAAYHEGAPVTFRVNALKATRDDLLHLLREEGIDALPTALSPDGITLDGRINLSRHPFVEGGLIEPQDEAAQISARLAGAESGMMVIDFCAGGGGKSLAMAAMMGNSGMIHAFDIEGRRLRDIRGRARRAGVRIIHPHVLRDDADEVLLPLAGAANRVFVDAPCSGSGTWRRQPDQKWKFSGERLDILVKIQQEILARAAPLVAPGGILIYATCSILREENEEQVAAFLATHTEFDLLPVSMIWTAAGLGGQWDQDFLSLTPADFGSDGFFVALLQKRD